MWMLHELSHVFHRLYSWAWVAVDLIQSLTVYQIVGAIHRDVVFTEWAASRDVLDSKSLEIPWKDSVIGNISCQDM